MAGTLERLAGRADVPRLDVQSRPYEPKLPIVGGALNRLAKITIGGLEVAAQLVDEGELKSGLGRPGLERARVTRILGG